MAKAPACRKPSTPVTVNTIVGTAEARNVSHSPRQPNATSPASAPPAAATCTPDSANEAPTATIVWVITHPASPTRSRPQPGSPSGTRPVSTAKNPASSTVPRTASSATAYPWARCARSTWARCWFPWSSLASGGISATPATQDSIPVTAAATPQRTHARSVT